MKKNNVKSVRYFLLITLFLVAFCLISLGCSSNSAANTIVGTWESTLMAATFFDDDTSEIDVMGITTQYDYTLTQDKLILESKDVSGIGLSYTCTFSDDGTKMYWQESDSAELIVFTKAEKAKEKKEILPVGDWERVRGDNTVIQRIRYNEDGTGILDNSSFTWYVEDGVLHELFPNGDENTFTIRKDFDWSMTLTSTEDGEEYPYTKYEMNDDYDSITNGVWSASCDGTYIGEIYLNDNSGSYYIYEAEDEDEDHTEGKFSWSIEDVGSSDYDIICFIDYATGNELEYYISYQDVNELMIYREGSSPVYLYRDEMWN